MVGRLEGLFVEAHGTVDHALDRRAVEFERHQVGGNQGERAGRAEMLHHGHAQRAALFGIGGGAQLVEQDQRIGRDIESHVADVGNVRREGAEVLLNRLVVSDIRQDLREERKLGLRGGHGQPGLGHQAQQAHGFQRDCFAAGIGAADEQRAAVPVQFQAHRHGRFAAPPQHVF